MVGAKKDHRRQPPAMSSTSAGSCEGPAVVREASEQNAGDSALQPLVEKLGRLVARTAISRRRGYAYPELILELIFWQIVARVVLLLFRHL